MDQLIRYRLQFFAEGAEKTEEATPKKLTDARKEGQVARSNDLITASVLLTLFLVLKVFVGTIGKNFMSTFISTYNQIQVYSSTDFNQNTAAQIFRDGIFAIIKTCLPFYLFAFAIALVTNIFQVKWQITLKPLKPKLSKFNPGNGFKRIFSKDKLLELIKEVAKISVIIYVVYNTLKKNENLLVDLYDMELKQALALIGNIVINLGIRISIIFLLIGFADYFYQKIKFKKDMRMTKQEVKDEFKQTEGDPQIKSKIRSKMREASQRRMMQRLPEADVVITNPTHFAAALKYDKEESEAPVLIAKGADYLAQKIKDIARENHVPIVENKPLARMLYYNVEIGNEIPLELYQMTAEVLAYVYSLNNKYM